MVGASLAVVQRNVKRMLAYSSINHAGFILLGVWAGTIRGTAATLFYVITYAPIVVATFAIVTLIGGVGDDHHSIERYLGLARRQPWLGAALAVLLLSQLGAPLTTGFYAKFAVLAVGRRRRRGSAGPDRLDQRRDRRLLLPALGHGPVLR